MPQRAGPKIRPEKGGLRKGIAIDPNQRAPLRDGSGHSAQRKTINPRGSPDAWHVEGLITGDDRKDAPRQRFILRFRGPLHELLQLDVLRGDAPALFLDGQIGARPVVGPIDQVPVERIGHGGGKERQSH